MIDLKLLQKDFDEVSRKLARKGVDASLMESLKTKNEELKVAKISFETLQAAQNSMSKEFGIYKREGKDISDPELRNLFNRDYVINSEWQKERLKWT